MYRYISKLLTCSCTVLLASIVFFSTFHYTKILLHSALGKRVVSKYERHQYLHTGDVGVNSASFLQNLTTSIQTGRSGPRNLVAPAWEARSLMNYSDQHRYTEFDQVITAHEFADMMILLRVFKSVCDSNNLTFMMYGGSLLGSYRHFGLIPWDDDIDVLMNTSDAVRIHKAFGRVPGFSIVTPANKQWKFYSLNEYKSCCLNYTKAKTGYACRCIKWPNIDIFFFRENVTHIWDYVPGYSDVYCYHKNDVFPLISYPFEEFLMPVPRKIRTIVRQSYYPELCVSRSFNHKTRQQIPRVHTVPCRRMFQYYPFVFDISQGIYKMKKLQLGNTKLFETTYLTVPYY